MRQPGRPYSRMARVNETLRHAIALELERICDQDGDLPLITVTAVECDTDLTRAKVYLADLDEHGRELLRGYRQRLQSTLARTVRMKRTPQLSFELDPAIVNGEIVERALRQISRSDTDSG